MKNYSEKRIVSVVMMNSNLILSSTIENINLSILFIFLALYWLIQYGILLTKPNDNEKQ